MSLLGTAVYYASRPKFWPFGFERLRRRLSGITDANPQADAAIQWAADRAVTLESALRQLGIVPAGAPMPSPIPPALLAEAEEARQKSGVKMGGPGDLELLHSAVVVNKCQNVIETGVAYGWSSLVILDALQPTGGRLVSVDMPYFRAGLERYVGLVVPDRLRANWDLIREPDRNGVKKAIRRIDGALDLCHYDSDKSYAGRMYAYPLLWSALRKGGIFISDDIQDDFGFRDFATKVGAPFAVVGSSKRFVGIMVKP